MEPHRHTLMLVQFNASLSSRTFLDYASPHAAMDGVCVLYEKELQVLNPKAGSITYDISDLYTYIDQLADISLLMCAALLCTAFFSWLSARKLACLFARCC